MTSPDGLEAKNGLGGRTVLRFVKDLAGGSNLFVDVRGSSDYSLTSEERLSSGFERMMISIQDVYGRPKPVILVRIYEDGPKTAVFVPDVRSIEDFVVKGLYEGSRNISYGSEPEEQTLTEDESRLLSSTHPIELFDVPFSVYAGPAETLGHTNGAPRISIAELMHGLDVDGVEVRDSEGELYVSLARVMSNNELLSLFQDLRDRFGLRDSYLACIEPGIRDYLRTYVDRVAIGQVALF